MNPALVILNPRRITPFLKAMETVQIPKVWITGYTEAQIAAGVFGRMLEDTAFSHYIVVSDDCEPLPGAIEAVCSALEDNPVATGWCCVDEVSTMVNLCHEPLRGIEPTRGAYSFMDREDVVRHQGVFLTHFAGMSLTGMSRELWERFPFGVFGGSGTGWASDFHLSIRLRDAGVPIVAVVDAECVHHRADWLTPERTGERRLLIGEIEPCVWVETP